MSSLRTSSRLLDSLKDPFRSASRLGCWQKALLYIDGSKSCEKKGVSDF
jgi:hypothetical protein